MNAREFSRQLKSPTSVTRKIDNLCDCLSRDRPVYMRKRKTGFVAVLEHDLGLHGGQVDHQEYEAGLTHEALICRDEHLIDG